MEWWIWCVLGVVLLGAELLIPGGFFLFVVGLGALTLGALTLIGVPLSDNAQYLLFAFLSLVFLFTLRRKLDRRLFRNSPDISDDLSGKEISVSKALAPNEEGSIEFRGTVWRALNHGDSALSQGDKARIERVDGLKLILKKI